MISSSLLKTRSLEVVARTVVNPGQADRVAVADQTVRADKVAAADQRPADKGADKAAAADEADPGWGCPPLRTSSMERRPKSNPLEDEEARLH
jgi:hypothetical protein